VGIDVSKKKLDVGILGEAKRHISFKNSIEGITDLIDHLKEESVGRSPVVLESTGNFHLLSATLLRESGFRVHVINPLITKRYEKSSIRGSKTDKIDCLRLAEIAYLEDDLPEFDSEVGDIEMKKLTKLLAKLENINQKLTSAYDQYQKTAESLGFSKKKIYELEKTLIWTKKAHQSISKMIRKRADDKTKKLSEKMPGISERSISILLSNLKGKEFVP